MTGTLQITPESLRSVCTGLQQVGDQLDGAVNQLESYVRSLGQPWGNDEIGQLIGVAFEEVISYAFECLREVLDEIRESATDLNAMADRYDAAEQQFIQTFRSLGENLGGW